jgi:hypothetical protein
MSQERDIVTCYLLEVEVMEDPQILPQLEVVEVEGK